MTPCADCGLRICTEQGSESDDQLCEACSGLAANDLQIRVSPLSEDDLELVCAWRSNPRIYRHFRRQDGPLGWDEHVEWFHSRHEDQHDFVIWYEGRRVGVVSIDASDEIGILIGDFSAREQGIATAALRWLCGRFRNRSPLTAEIHVDNAPSKRLFQRCGFRDSDQEGEWITYVYEPSSATSSH